MQELWATMAIMEHHTKYLIIKTKICLRSRIQAYQTMAQASIPAKYLLFAIMLLVDCLIN